MAARYVDDPDEADDVAQEALLRAWRHRGSLRSAERVGGWLRCIVRNEAARLSARRRPEPVDRSDQVGGAEDPMLLTAPLRADLAAAMGCLERRERLLLGLRYGEDLTQPAIARLLEVPEGTVKVRLHRARTKLHRSLNEP